MANKYAIVNTQLNQVNATLIEQLNGRQGDSGRVVYFSLKDGNIPHDISNQRIEIIVKDSSGTIKVFSTINNVISSVGGLFSMIVPGELYQSAGDVQEAFMRIYDNKNIVITSIPITFTVFANNIILTSNASETYIDSVQQAINKANELILGLNNNINAQKTAYDILKSSLEVVNGEITNAQVAKINTTNEFSEVQNFTGGVQLNGVDITPDSELVHKHGDEQIFGVKSYDSPIIGNVAGKITLRSLDYNSNFFTGDYPVAATIKNGICSLEVNLKYIVDTTTDTTILKLPPDLYPANNVWSRSIIHNSLSQDVRLCIQKDGIFVVKGAQPNTTSVTATITYLLA